MNSASMCGTFIDLLLDPARTAGKIANLLRTWPTVT